jgi:hypothetical protein
MNITKFLNNTTSLEIFYQFLKFEFNCECLTHFIILKNILESSEFIETNDFIQIFENFKEKFVNEFNFSKYDNDLLKKKEENRDEMNLSIKIIMSCILENINDPYYRFCKNELYFNEYLLALEESNKKSTINSIIKEETWVFNNHTIFPSHLQNKRNQVIISQVLYSSFLRYLINQKKNQEIFDELIEKTLELQILDVESLELNEQLCFYLNIFNSLIIHSSIQLSEGSPLTPKEFQSYLNLCHYNLGGKIVSLREMKTRIEKVYNLLIYDQETILPLICSITNYNYKNKFEVFYPKNIVSDIKERSKIFLSENHKFDEDYNVQLPWTLREFLISTKNIDKAYVSRIHNIFPKSKDEVTKKDFRKSNNSFSSEKFQNLDKSPLQEPNDNSFNSLSLSIEENGFDLDFDFKKVEENSPKELYKKKRKSSILSKLFQRRKPSSENLDQKNTTKRKSVVENSNENSFSQNSNSDSFEVSKNSQERNSFHSTNQKKINIEIDFEKESIMKSKIESLLREKNLKKKNPKIITYNLIKDTFNEQDSYFWENCNNFVFDNFNFGFNFK